MDLSFLMNEPSAALLISAAVGIAAFWINKQIERKITHDNMRRTLYSDYIGSLNVYTLRTIRTDHEGRRASVEMALSLEAKIMIFGTADIAAKLVDISSAHHEYVNAIRSRYEKKGPEISTPGFNELATTYSANYKTLIAAMRKEVKSPGLGDPKAKPVLAP